MLDISINHIIEHTTSVVKPAGAPILAKYDADCASRTESQGFNEFAAVDSVNPLCSLSYWVNNHLLKLKIDAPGQTCVYERVDQGIAFCPELNYNNLIMMAMRN